MLAARDGALDDTRLDWIFGFFPPLQRFWLSRAGTLSGGQKQMLSHRARHHRAAQAAADRRADQGPCARDHRRADRVPARSEAARARRSCWSSRISASRRRSATTCCVMDNGRIVHRGTMARTRRRRGAAAQAARPQPGRASMSATDNAADDRRGAAEARSATSCRCCCRSLLAVAHDPVHPVDLAPG